MKLSCPVKKRWVKLLCCCYHGGLSVGSSLYRWQFWSQLNSWCCFSNRFSGCQVTAWDYLTKCVNLASNTSLPSLTLSFNPHSRPFAFACSKLQGEHRVSSPYSPPNLFLCIVFSGKQKNRPYAIFTAEHPVIVISSSKNSAMFT